MSTVPQPATPHPPQHATPHPPQPQSYGAMPPPPGPRYPAITLGALLLRIWAVLCFLAGLVLLVLGIIGLVAGTVAASVPPPEMADGEMLPWWPGEAFFRAVSFLAPVIIALSFWAMGIWALMLASLSCAIRDTARNTYRG